MYILLAILVFGILIAVHELGHFLVAKACGVRVDEFAIGMGPAIWKKQKGETLYTVRCLPIGGFCAMAGEDETIDDPRAFTSQPAWKRFLILCAGAFMNFVFGLLLLLLVFAQAKSFSTPTLTDFMDGCPYQGENALQVGDTIWSIDGHRIYFTTNVSEYLSRGGDTHDIVVKRDGAKVHLDDFYLAAREYPGQSSKMYGFYFGTQPATFGAKLQNAWYSALDFVRMVWRGPACGCGRREGSVRSGRHREHDERGRQGVGHEGGRVFQFCVFLGVHCREPCGHEYAAAAGA